MIENEILNEDLQLADLPPPNADWGEINRFAHTFNGYEAWGSFERCANVALSRKHGTLTELRTCLFFEQRAMRHNGDTPDEEDMGYWHFLIEEIRRCVAEGRLD